MLNADQSLLVVIDIQGKLADAVAETESLIANTQRLIGSANAVGVPVLVSEHFRIYWARPAMSSRPNFRTFSPS